MFDRFTVMTHNVWADTRWPEREASLRAFYDLRRPDILATQELRPATRAVIDEVLTGHDRVHDDFEGWQVESNLWWDRTLFEELEHGALDIGHEQATERDRLRRVFWVRLRTRETQRRLLVATAHFTWPGTPQEKDEGRNPRIPQAHRTAEGLPTIAGEDACLFMGDLNEHYHPVRILRDAGFMDSFGALGAISPPTHPAVPTARPAPNWLSTHDTPVVIDWQFHRGPIRPDVTEVVDYYDDELAPSDHKPIITAYRLL